jgi:hypothetical protein
MAKEFEAPEAGAAHGSRYGNPDFFSACGLAPMILMEAGYGQAKMF